MTEPVILDSSPQAKALALVKRSTYPFDKLGVGQSFKLPLLECNVKSLRSIASRKSKDGKRFVVIEHAELNAVEVARQA